MWFRGEVIAIAIVLAGGAIAACGSDATPSSSFGPNVTSEPAFPDDPFGDGGTDAAVAPGTIDPHPDFGPTVSAAVAPPPIFGGTLYVTENDAFAIAADPDRDQIHVVDLATKKLRGSINLPSQSLPFRVTEDGSHLIHVTLRGSGRVVTIDPTLSTIVRSVEVCSEPRGIASIGDHLVVACDRGYLVVVDAATGAIVDRERTVAHPRDVIPTGVGEGFFLTTFQGARLLRFASPKVLLEEYPNDAGPKLSMTYAWRAARRPNGTIVMSHQQASLEAFSTAPGGYGSQCSTPISGVVSQLAGTHLALYHRSYGNGVIPVDLALSPDGNEELIALPGNTAMVGMPSWVFASSGSTPDVPCFAPSLGGGGEDRRFPVGKTPAQLEVTAVAWTHAGVPLLQSREPASLTFLDQDAPHAPHTVVVLSKVSRADTGHAIFHRNASNVTGASCASCHAEGGEDGLTWRANDGKVVSPKRTQTLRGTVIQSAPYHWVGDEPNLTSLMAHVYTQRMLGIALAPEQDVAFRHWLGSLRAPSPDEGADAVAAGRGEDVFANRGCANCHGTGDHPSAQSFDVGSGGSVQVPSIVGLGLRAPYMHDGCAPTVAALLAGTGCGDATKHGELSTLTPEEAADLRVYLDSR